MKDEGGCAARRAANQTNINANKKHNRKHNDGQQTVSQKNHHEFGCCNIELGHRLHQ
jgi:hypothetical protein